MPKLPQIAVIACGGFLKTKRVMKTIFKIIVSPIIFLFTTLMVWFPLNIISYFIAMFGFLGIFKHISYSIMKWENDFDYPIDHFKNPIYNYLAGSTLHIWLPFYSTYLFIFKEEEYRNHVANLFD